MVSYPAGYAGNFGGNVGSIDSQVTGSDLQNMQIHTPNTIFPTMPGKFPNFATYGTQNEAVNIIDSLLKGHMTVLNPCWINYP